MSRKVLRMADFEWASGTKYIVYLSAVLELEEINMNSVYSFRLSSLGAKKLIGQKASERNKAVNNMKAVERWAGKNADTLAEEEKEILITMYNQYKGVVQTCVEHIETANKLVAIEKISLLGEVDESDDFPF